MSSQSEILKMLENLSKVTKGELNTEQLVFMSDILSKYNIEDIKDAVSEGVETWTWFPTVAEIVSIIKSKKTKQLPSAHSAFDKILQHVQRNGCNAKIQGLLDIEYDALRAIGGLRAVGNCTDDDLKWLRKDFVQFFEQRVQSTPLRGFQDLLDDPMDEMERKRLN